MGSLSKLFMLVDRIISENEDLNGCVPQICSVLKTEYGFFEGWSQNDFHTSQIANDFDEIIIAAINETRPHAVAERL